MHRYSYYTLCVYFQNAFNDRTRAVRSLPTERILPLLLVSEITSYYAGPASTLTISFLHHCLSVCLSFYMSSATLQQLIYSLGSDILKERCPSFLFTLACFYICLYIYFFFLPNNLRHFPDWLIPEIFKLDV